MDRRMFLKAAGAGLAHPAGLLAMGPALVRQGERQLKDITPAEIEEIIAWMRINPKRVCTVKDQQSEQDEPVQSLHPVYYCKYDEGEPEIGVRESVTFHYWWSSTNENGTEWDEGDARIEIGDIMAHYCYSIAKPDDLVKWFLEHGFKVW
jgi:hypothetical protein